MDPVGSGGGHACSGSPEPKGDKGTESPASASGPGVAPGSRVSGAARAISDHNGAGGGTDRRGHPAQSTLWGGGLRRLVPGGGFEPRLGPAEEGLDQPAQDEPLVGN